MEQPPAPPGPPPGINGDSSGGPPAQPGVTPVPPQAGPPQGASQVPPTPPQYVPPQGAPPVPPVAPATPPVKKKGLPRGAKIAIIIGAVALLLVAIIVILVVVVFVNVLSEPVDVANDFMEVLDSGSTSEAYGYFSELAKKETPISDFTEFKKLFEGNIESYNTSEVQIRNNYAFVPMDVTLSSGETTTLYFQLVKKQGEWEILNIYVGEKPSDWPED